MSKNEVVIIISGVKYINSQIPLIKRTVLSFYKLLRISKPVYENYAVNWKDKLSNNNREILILDWDEKLNPLSLWLAKIMLKIEINKHLSKNYKVNIIGFSMGGKIVLDAIKNFDDGEINKVILVSSINTNNIVDKNITKFLNIYSPFDLLAEIGIKAIAPIHGGDILKGNSVKNIVIEKFSHEQFSTDEIINNGQYKGMRITDLINEFINN